MAKTGMLEGMEIGGGLLSAVGIQEFTVVVRLLNILAADPGIAYCRGALLLSGVHSLELLNVVTNEEALDK